MRNHLFVQRGQREPGKNPLVVLAVLIVNFISLTFRRPLGHVCAAVMVS